MKEIQLTHGKVAIVDDDMYDFLNQWKWYAWCDHNRNWYARRSIFCNSKSRTLQMQTLILPTPEGKFPDHKNGNGLDNRRENLRVATKSENGQNQKVRSGNKSSIFKGVHWIRRDKRWRSCIKKNMKVIYLGQFTSEIEAALAYDEAAKKYFGEFARPNFPLQVQP